MSTTAAPDLSSLEARCTGEVVGPDDPRWDAARAAWNLALDQRPAAVVIAADEADIEAAVSFAAGEGLRVAPQATGHNAGPLELGGTLLVKTSLLTGVEVDPDGRRARVRAGTLAEELAGAAAEHGLAPLGGSSPDVGSCGYALGGGVGWLGRRHGLQCGAIVAAELVLADGSRRRIDDDADPDLIWALRGGGGNFGVVTALELELFPYPTVYAGALAWDWSRSADVLHRWHEWTADAPESATTSARILQLPPLPEIPEPLRGRQLVMVDGAITDSDAGEAVLAPLRELEPEIDTFATMPAAGLCRIHGDPDHPVPGVSSTAMVAELTEEAIDALVAAAGPGSGSPLLFVELRHLGGAMGRPGERDAAHSHFVDPFAFFSVGMAMDPEMGRAVAAHTAKARDSLSEWSSGRLALNWAETTVDPARGFNAETWQRLRGVKSRVDPEGLILANHPVPQAG